MSSTNICIEDVIFSNCMNSSNIKKFLLNKIMQLFIKNITKHRLLEVNDLKK